MKEFVQLVKAMRQAERYYDNMNGIVGYAAVLRKNLQKQVDDFIGEWEKQCGSQLPEKN